MSKKVKTDLYEQITNQVISALENGVKPWHKPWKNGTPSFPHNFKTKAAYRGINVLSLWATALDAGFDSSWWLTYKQAQELGGQVRKGEKSTLGVFYKKIDINVPEEDRNEDGNEVRSVLMARSFWLFNASQIDGIDFGDELQGTEFSPINDAEQLLQSSGAEIIEGGARAYYRSADDAIRLPERRRFDQAEDFYATATHELTHWTGHKSRLDRQLGNRFGSEAYAVEELIAELGSAFVNADIGLQGELQHASYIESWLKVLKKDKKAIFTAASQAAKAHQFIMQLSEPEQLDTAA